jgi:predicted transcriptional regulator
MGASKTEHFTNEQNEQANLFKALGHPARIAIIQHILKTASCVCGDLVDTLPLSQATVSQHLRELKLANIIKGTIEGNSICYCLNPETLHQLQVIITFFVEQEKCKSTSCC